jgi:uncharacterized protein YdhG (YjbR/CyaY superfamily)
MKIDRERPDTIDAYIGRQPEKMHPVLERVRAAIKKAAPQATEAITYQLPTFRLNGNLVHFGAFKNHIGFYPTPSGIKAFTRELSTYKTSKGAVQFPLDQPVPLNLIVRIVRFRVKENLGKKKSIK